MRKIVKSAAALALVPVFALFAGCGGGPGAAAQSKTAASVSVASVPTASAPQKTAGGLAIPAFRESEFHAAAAQGENGVQIDLSCTAEGYVAVSAVSESRLKFQAALGDTTYTYDLPQDGTPAVFPFNCGDGTYTLRVMQNIGGSQYVALYETKAEVALADAFEPFLRPSQLVNYGANSACVAKARQLAEGCATDTEMAAAVYAYLTENVAYDYEKAKTVEKGYLPDPDETLASGKGICFDYAALAAAMLRSAGIPTRLITGYVGDIYHAWNEIYLKEQGWITVEIAASPGSWQRIDTTFAANDVDPSFLTDDTNYVNRYTY
ncbi:MAG: transglutaminase-like domain-containing protein [Faecalibacterium sp.]|nr:transglutaminase-like domain-containing protein [Faecalibacterium sp.]